MAVYKEINRADGSGVTTFYRISNVLDTAETDDQEGQAVIVDYNQAQNKPSINGVTLIGNKTTEDLGLQPAGDYITNDEADEKFIDEDELEAKNYVNQAELQDAIAHIEHFHREIVEALPITGMDNVLYMVRKGGTGEDIYNEYIWVGLSSSEDGYEFLGTTATDLTDYYKKSQVDAALATKVDKEGGKGLSEQNYTLAEKTKLAGLENYDDTEIQAEVSGLSVDVNNLKSSNVTVSNTLAELKPDVDSNTAAVSTIYDLLDNKMTAIRLVEQGDGWVWMNLEGSRLTYAQASAALGHENCVLFIEQLENDGKVIPAEYKSEGDHINVIFKDLDSLVHVMTCGEDDLIVEQDVSTTNGQVDFTVEDEAIGYTTKMTTLYGDMKIKGLPSEYTAVDFIASNGSQYIDTGIKPTGATKVESVIETFAIPDANAFFYGGRNGVSVKGFGCGTQPNIIGSYGSNNEFTSHYIQPNTKYTIVQTNKLTINGTEIYSYGAETFTCDYNLYIFAMNNGNNHPDFVNSYKLYSMKIYDDNTLVRYFIPCYRRSDTTVGLYDIVNGVFYTSQGFTYGSAINFPNLNNPQIISTVYGVTNFNVNENNMPLNLGITELYKTDTHQDKIYKQNDKWYIHKEIGKVILNGTQEIYKADTATEGYGRFNFEIGRNIITVSNHDTVGEIYSDFLRAVSRGNTYQKIDGIALSTDDYSYRSFNIYLDIWHEMTAAQVSNWLSNHNITVYYILKNPIDTEITDPTLLAQLNALEQITQYKNTYITIGGVDLTPEADFTYIDNVVINNTDLVLGKDTYWNDEVPTQQDLPSNAQEGEIRIVQDTENVYIYNGTKWVPFDKSGEVDLSNYLAKDNTTAWIPTGPFNPSTKKYVDDSISGIHVPTKTSQLTNDSNFINKNANDLTNYYPKSNTYTRAEVDALIHSGGTGVQVVVVGDTLVITTVLPGGE